MKKEIDQISDGDALAIYNGIKPTLIKGGIKESVREHLRKNKLSVTDALVIVEKSKSSIPKSKAF